MFNFPVKCWPASPRVRNVILCTLSLRFTNCGSRIDVQPEPHTKIITKPASNTGIPLFMRAQTLSTGPDRLKTEPPQRQKLPLETCAKRLLCESSCPESLGFSETRFPRLSARVAELADALDSGSSE